MSPARPPSAPDLSPSTSPSAPTPFDAARALLADLPPADAADQAAARSLIDRYDGAFGTLGDLAVFLAGWTGGKPIAKPLFALYVATYAEPGRLSGDAPSRARALIARLADGGGAISALARSLGAGVEAFDLALDRPVPHPRDGAPLSLREAAATLAFGMEALAKGPDILVLTDGVERSAEVAADAAAVLEQDDGDALDRLADLGGREISALAGAILAARVQKVPVVLESAAALTAAALLSRGRQGALDHCVAAGPSPLQARLGLTPVTGLTGATEPGVAGAAALAQLKLASELARPPPPLY